MIRRRIYLLATVLAAVALTVSHAATPRAVRADDNKYLWTTSELGETCAGKCGAGQRCCRIVGAPAPPP
jgi:hypothetical protein